MCLITDPDGPVAIGGVMGGAHSEVSATTTDVLIEAARFDPLSIRNTARALNLHSPSSYRFERGIDPDVVDWASRRCCELILKVAGGQLATGMIDIHPSPSPPRRPDPAPVVAVASCPWHRSIAGPLPGDPRPPWGCNRLAVTVEQLEVDGPQLAGRRHAREIDLWKRSHAFMVTTKFPKIRPSPRWRPNDRSSIQSSSGFVARSMRAGLSRGHDGQCGHGRLAGDLLPLDSPITLWPPARRCCAAPTSYVRAWSPACWQPVARMRKSATRRSNCSKRPRSICRPAKTALPEEPIMLGITSGRSFLELKGILETLLAELRPGVELQLAPCVLPLCDEQHAIELRVQQDIGRLSG